MKTTRDKIMVCLLTPLSWIYGAVTGIRNWLFDSRILKEEEYDIPIIGVGNITVGGTGKTPHVEYIVSNLAADYKIAVLSRGYKRKTSGFVLANSNITPDLIGDEPFQIYRKFGMKVQVAVCENRRKGIQELLRLFPDLGLIVLDDSFQHRWVKPKVSVLLTDYSRPFYRDRLLPLGRLRESPSQVNRADMVVVTKCPDDLMPINFRITSKDLDLMKYQKLFFTRYEYGALEPVFPENAPYSASLGMLGAGDAVLLLTGIAHPRYFVRHFRNYPFKVKVDHYSDHHDFSRSDIDSINERFRSLPGSRKIIVTTEKDAMRLMHNPYFPESLKPFTFYLPVTVRLINGIDETDLIQELRNAIS
ncbi:MAG: tetraacyldisaccharide 4'-kinase [Muribaculaceae bacterium]|nr:tetraacyldisaccharide 4'-kinase [Muribaculaceae bacterium]MDE6532663.1 tetraacyldisaccharide 4'-kinase [Muribaculaceae bacterium]